MTLSLIRPPHATPAPSRGVRARFAETSAQTASPARLVTMLYDRLVRDLRDADARLAAHDLAGAHTALVHAQEIVAVLRTALDPSVWDGARQLGAIYDHVLVLLVDANVTKRRAPVSDALRIVEPLQQTWHDAFRATGTAAGA